MAKKTHEPDDERVAGGVGQLKPTSVSAEDRKRMRAVALKYRPWDRTPADRPRPKARRESPKMAGTPRRMNCREGN